MKLGAVGLRKRGSETAPPPEPEPHHGTGYWAPFYSTYIDPMGPDPSCFWGNVTSGQNEPASYRTDCADASDCSYNGVCGRVGVCECHPQWMGRRCG